MGMCYKKLYVRHTIFFSIYVYMFLARTKIKDRLDKGAIVHKVNNNSIKCINHHRLIHQNHNLLVQNFSPKLIWSFEIIFPKKETSSFKNRLLSLFICILFSFSLLDISFIISIYFFYLLNISKNYLKII